MFNNKHLNERSFIAIAKNNLVSMAVVEYNTYYNIAWPGIYQPTYLRFIFNKLK